MDIVEDGVTGWLVAPGDAQVLADRLVQPRDNQDFVDPRLAALFSRPLAGEGAD